MSRVAAQYGLSGNGLAKSCRRLDLPCPRRSYWARKKASKKVNQAALPAIRPGARAQGTIAPCLPVSPPSWMPSEHEEASTARRMTAVRRPRQASLPTSDRRRLGSRSASARVNRLVASRTAPVLDRPDAKAAAM